MQHYIAPILCLIIILGQVLTLEADTSTCPDIQVTITANDQDDVDIVCEAIQVTLQLTKRYDLEFAPRLDIDVVDRIKALQSSNRFGEFDPVTGKIVVLSSRSCEKAATEWFPFGQQMTRSLHRSLIVHELAHSVADWNFKSAEPGLLVHEYLAYVFQIASMPSDLQNAIFQQISVPGFQQASEINEIYYALNPDYFGVKAYHHFQMAKDRKALFRRLLAGELIPRDSSEDFWIEGID
jgi:hypothetical protein